MEQKQSISTLSFYGNNYKVSEKITRSTKTTSNDIIPFKMKDLVNGPPLIWKVFKKQVEALDAVTRYKCNLMAFVFECDNSRLFLVAHPEVFWHYNCQRPLKSRCSYEIITENTACKLYFDLEFNIPLNPHCNGPKMVENFITIVIHYLKEQFKIDSNPGHIINLDSSTEIKFSRHLIFNIPNVCFATNGHAGNFVNFVCGKITQAAENHVLPEIMGLSVEDYSTMVVDTKNKKTLFCDLSVYSRNRHFRLYKSTKFGKLTPLLLIPDSSTVVKDDEYDKKVFFSSLITYIPSDFEKLNVLCFENNAYMKQSLKKCEVVSYVSKEGSFSPYEEINNFINDLVFPGKIFRSFYFPTSKIINYDITGNRFCGNIGRSHKRNNVKYIVDLNDGTYYQKCHDLECSSYKSTKNYLPKKLQLLDFVDAPSNLGSFDMINSHKHSFKRFPSCGLGDEEIVNHFEDQALKRVCTSDLKEQKTSSNSTGKAVSRFPSFDLSDEEIINHITREKLNV